MVVLELLQGFYMNLLEGVHNGKRRYNEKRQRNNYKTQDFIDHYIN